MTEVLLVSVYLFALAAFVGLDVISKAPPAIYGVMITLLGVLTAFAGIGAIGSISIDAPALSNQLGMAGAALGGIAFGAGITTLGKLLGVFQKGGH